MIARSTLHPYPCPVDGLRNPRPVVTRNGMPYRWAFDCPVCGAVVVLDAETAEYVGEYPGDVGHRHGLRHYGRDGR